MYVYLHLWKFSTQIATVLSASFLYPVQQQQTPVNRHRNYLCKKKSQVHHTKQAMTHGLATGGLKSFQVGNYWVKAMVGHWCGRGTIVPRMCKGLSQPVFAVAFKPVHAQSPPETSECTAKTGQWISPWQHHLDNVDKGYRHQESQQLMQKSSLLFYVKINNI